MERYNYQFLAEIQNLSINRAKGLCGSKEYTHTSNRVQYNSVQCDVHLAGVHVVVLSFFSL